MSPRTPPSASTTGRARTLCSAHQATRGEHVVLRGDRDDAGAHRVADPGAHVRDLVGQVHAEALEDPRGLRRDGPQTGRQVDLVPDRSGSSGARRRPPNRSSRCPDCDVRRPGSVPWLPLAARGVLRVPPCVSARTPEAGSSSRSPGRSTATLSPLTDCDHAASEHLVLDRVAGGAARASARPRAGPAAPSRTRVRRRGRWCTVARPAHRSAAVAPPRPGADVLEAGRADAFGACTCSSGISPMNMLGWLYCVAAEELPHGGVGDVEPLARAGDAHVGAAGAPPRAPLVEHRVRVREEPVLHAEHEHDRELEALGRVQRHQRDRAFALLERVEVASQRHPLEERLERRARAPRAAGRTRRPRRRTRGCSRCAASRLVACPRRERREQPEQRRRSPRPARAGRPRPRALAISRRRSPRPCARGRLPSQPFVGGTRDRIGERDALRRSRRPRSVSIVVLPMPWRGFLMIRARATGSAGFATARRYAITSRISARSKKRVPPTSWYGTPARRNWSSRRGSGRSCGRRPRSPRSCGARRDSSRSISSTTKRASSFSSLAR